MTFYRCEHCGNIIAHIQDSGVRCHCCGEEMKPLTPNTTDAAGEKHVPVVQVNGRTVTVTVGSVEHPMLEAGYETYRNGNNERTANFLNATRSAFELAYTI